MLVVKYDKNELEKAYGISCQRLYPVKGAKATPFGALKGIVGPGEISTRHNHHELESFYVLKGEGLVDIEGKKANLKEGDIIMLPPFESHTIENLSEDEDLEFLAIWWEDLSQLKTENKKTLTQEVMVTATPPTPNGDLHVGHISGPFLGADIYAKFQKMNGNSTFYLTGSDENQSYIPLKAAQVNQLPLELANNNAAKIQESLKSANIDYQGFYEPSKINGYNQIVDQFFKKLHADGKLIEKNIPSYFTSEDVYLHEAFVSGICPKCSSGSDGNACEQCGHPNDNVDLIDASAKMSDKPLVLKDSKRLYFPLSQYEDQLKDYYDKAAIPAHLRTLCYQMIEDGLPDIAISHITEWGVPVSVDGFEDQKYYVWAEMIVGYIHALTEHKAKDSDELIKLWNDSVGELVQFFGFDNGYYHAVLFPALLMAYSEDAKLADGFVINEFLKLDDLKFSTSRNHLIWAQELLSDYDSDYVRLYLSNVRPETEQTNFTKDNFFDFINLDFNNSLRTWLNPLLKLASDDFNGIVPAPGAWTKEHKSFYSYLNHQHDIVSDGYSKESFSTQKVLRSVRNIIEEASLRLPADIYYSKSSLLHDTYRTSIALQFSAIKSVVKMLAPIMPNMMSKFAESMSFSLAWSNEATFVDENTKVNSDITDVIIDIEQM